MKPGIPAVATAYLLALVPAYADEPGDRHFVDRVKPLLELRCIACHGPEKQKGGLRLDSRAAALKGGDQGPSVVPGKPHESLLVQAVMHAKPDLEMPPKDRLSRTDVAIFERWIHDGAPWVEPSVQFSSAKESHPGERFGDAWTDPRNPIVQIFGGERLDLWSLKPIQRPKPPAGAMRGLVRNSIDRFVLARLAEAGLEPSPEADRRTQARRLFFDLTGLPPSAAEVAAFTGDNSPDAYERLLDRLLDSPRYGEHQARLWLDVIRYSDSNGFDWDEFRPSAWRFRDYVVRSFNADKPFNRFVREQLAGDELLGSAPRDAAEQDLLIATGYLRVGPQDNSAGLFNEQARARAEWLADLTETTGSAFLGLTLSCCRCHDHKFDPLSQADHFRLRAFFQAVAYHEEGALDLAPDQAVIRAQHAAIDEEIKPLASRRDEQLGAVKKRLRDERVAKLSEEERRLLAMVDDPQPQDFKEKSAKLEKQVEATDDEARKAFSDPEKELDAALSKQINALKGRKLPFTRGLLATDAAGEVAPSRILYQGDYRAERDTVPPGFLSALDPNPAEIHRGENTRTTGRRLTLADWIVSPANPLTARVLVNRAWQSFFGRGLVATSSDFGLAGARPTHPELLDWLASEFIASGWSVKKLHRLIVTSATYRQASHTEAEPGVRDMIPGKNTNTGRGTPRSAPDAALQDNLLFRRQNLRRLSAEQLRDSLLSVAGTLQLRPGGAPIWPELPSDVLQANPAFLDDNAEKTKGWYPSPPDERTVRSVYLVQKRTVRVPFLETFDLPENSVSCSQRNVSIVAPQALSLLNSDESLEAVRAFAARVVAEVGTPSMAQVEQAFSLALQRMPTSVEAKACEAFLRQEGLPALCRALVNLNEFVYLD